MPNAGWPMPSQPQAVMHYVRAAVGPDPDGPRDADLLARFAAARDEGAFELLVWRHAGMVLRVCRAATGDHHAAEDAAQAVFLALARQAVAVGRRGTVAGWLYRVARRVGGRAALRQRKQPGDAIVTLDALPGPGPTAQVDADEVRLLHHELDRLPEKDRAAVVLCFLEGLTHADAARRLGWPLGTLAARLARAKDRLRRRLAGRGVVAPAAGFTAAAVAPAFAAATARAATAFAAGTAVTGVSVTSIELAREAIRAMSATKLQWAAGLLAACGTLVFGGVWAAGQGPGQGPTGRAPGAAAGQPAERRADAAQYQRSLNNLKQIMLAMHSHADATGLLPADIRSKDGKALLSWRVQILPYIEQGELYRQFKLDQPWDSEHNLRLLARLPAVYRVGIEADGATHTYYQVFAGPGTPFEPGGRHVILTGPIGEGGAGGPGAAAPGGGAPLPMGSPAGSIGAGAGREGAIVERPGIRIADIHDGTSNTLAVVEAGPPVPWTKPADLPYDPKQPLPELAGPFSNAIHVALLDGSATSLRRGIDATILRRLIERGDGHPIPSLTKLQGYHPADSPADRAALRKLLGENRQRAAEIERLTREYRELIGALNRSGGDIGQAEEQAEKLKEIAELLKALNNQLRDDRR